MPSVSSLGLAGQWLPEMSGLWAVATEQLPVNEQELLALITEYGNATFACGEEDGPSWRYEPLSDKAEALRAQIVTEIHLLYAQVSQ